jgi:uncharacterized repeat protein (TIGR01451 family)
LLRPEGLAREDHLEGDPRWAPDYRNVRKVTLKVRKVASRTSVHAGATVTYTIKVTNTSKGQARDVKTCDQFPSGIADVSSTPKAELSKGQHCWTAKLFKAGGAVLPDVITG